MKITGLISQEVSLTTTRKDMREAIEEFMLAFAGVGIIDIDDRTVVDMCENCNLPIFSDQKYWVDEDGVRWHRNGECECEP